MMSQAIEDRCERCIGKVDEFGRVVSEVEMIAATNERLAEAVKRVTRYGAWELFSARFAIAASLRLPPDLAFHFVW